MRALVLDGCPPSACACGCTLTAATHLWPARHTRAHSRLSLIQHRVNHPLQRLSTQRLAKHARLGLGEPLEQRRAYSVAVLAKGAVHGGGKGGDVTKERGAFVLQVHMQVQGNGETRHALVVGVGVAHGGEHVGCRVPEGGRGWSTCEVVVNMVVVNVAKHNARSVWLVTQYAQHNACVAQAVNTEARTGSVGRHGA